jgi:hypothetical protein
MTTTWLRKRPKKVNPLCNSVKAGDLKAFNVGEAHTLDLVHDGKLYRDKEHQPVMIDFDELDASQMTSLKFERKRRKR